MVEDKPHGKGPKQWLGYVVAGLTAAAVSVAIYAGAQYLYQKVAGTTHSTVLDSPASAESPEVGILKKTSESFRAISKMVGPAVVTIKASKEKPKRTGPRRGGRFRGNEAPDEDSEEFQDFLDPFHEFFERFGQPMPVPDTPSESLGSGFIIDKRGYIVTNNHVVKNTNKVVVIPLGEDSAEIKAKIVGTDPRSDLAVLKLEKGGDYPTVEWADSDQVEVGDWAIALGSPFNLDHSMTVGIVSAKGRNSQAISGNQYGSLIQTDAAINPGNSGGPLCTIEGKVMGVNQAIYTRSGGYMGIGFAIPSNMAKNVVQNLIDKGKVVRGWLGVYIQPVKSELLDELDIKNGIAVQRVMEGSPADKAGIKAGDVITEVEGKKMLKVNELQLTISEYPPGKSIRMKVVSYTDKKEREVKVAIGELPDETPDSSEETQEPSGTPDELGLIVAPSSDGLVVKDIAPESPAGGLLKPGDVIAQVNRKKVKTVEEYKSQIKGKRHINLLVLRRGQTMFFQFTLPE